MIRSKWEVTCANDSYIVSANATRRKKKEDDEDSG